MPRVSKKKLGEILRKHEDPHAAVEELNREELDASPTDDERETKRKNPCWHVCPVCSAIFWRYPSWTARATKNGPACSRTCACRNNAWSEEALERSAQRVRNNPRKKRVHRPPSESYFDIGPRVYGKYIFVPCPDEFASMAYKHGLVPLHRLEAAKKLGRMLEKTEKVFHLNGDTFDNRHENLVVGKGEYKKNLEKMGRDVVLGTPRVKCPPEFASMADANGKVLVTRLAAAKKVGRPLASNESVAFLDGNRKNLSPDNIRILRTHLRGKKFRDGELVVCPPGFESMASADGCVRADVLKAAKIVGGPLTEREEALFPGLTSDIKLVEEDIRSIAEKIIERRKRKEETAAKAESET